MKTVVVIPTYDEKDNVRPMANAVLSFLSPQDRLLFVDDNSPDGTGAVLDALALEMPQVSVLHRERKEGLGRAYIAGFAKALAMGADKVVEMDCDFSHNPAMLPELVASGVDVAVGSRYVKGGSTPGWPWRRRLVSRLGGMVTRFVTGMPLRDPTGGFKCFTRRALEALGDFSEIHSLGYSFQLEMNYRMWKKGFLIKELPIEFVDRKAGYSKITGGIAVESLRMVFSLRFERLLVWLRAMRLRQWTKNILILAAWFFASNDSSQHAHTFGWRPLVLIFGMFASFCLIASAFYLINDVRDASSDRLHPVKRNRPVAAGLVSSAQAIRVAAVLLVLGFIPSLIMMFRHLDRWPMIAVVGGYSAMQLGYTGVLKRVPYLDVVIIAAGFVLRAVAGTSVLDVRLSPWLLVCTFSLALFVALCKRRHEKMVSEESRPALAGYRLPLLDAMILLSAIMTFAIYLAYTLAPETIARYEAGYLMVLTVLPVGAGILRYLRLVYSKADVGRPERILLSDPILWTVIAIYVAVAAMVMV